MGSQTPTSSDRSRTYWTPSMERYFIDLMLDQMHKQNRIGHTFNKQAWTDMLTTFNSNFGSQYDKDVLKSRYTNLWKQFNDIKVLLDQSGFSWDETRQMVTADEYVWDAYIKAHPDARCYKTKTMMNYNDLCMIYGYTTADGRYSRSSHDIDLEDDFPGVNTGDGMGSLAITSIEHSRTDWTPPMDRYFIDLMLDQLHRGNKTDHTFNKQAWTDMLAFFNARFGSQHGKRVLRHRYKKLWKYYNDVMILLDQSGFSWDETQQMVTADDDVWDAYIKAHPHARLYRTKILPNYRDLGLIYGNAIVDGRCSHLGRDKDLEDGVLVIKTGEGKESLTPTSSDRSRTYWTPPMDRYLIDLLLDQVHRGNKIGPTFISQAWVDMVTLFNSKFGSQHDKDVLKNRYKHLRRQHNDIKVLLEQNGFAWDETREMVTAEDHVWDAYTKAHPDARSYRVKTVPSYNKLCVIYGKESSDGRYNRLARNIDLEDDIPGVNSGEGKDGQAPTNSDRSRTDWTPSMDRYFIDLMLEQVHKGNKIDHTFNKQAWTDMIALFNAKFGSQHEKDVLRSRHKNLRKQYNDIKILLDQGGFAWDETRQMVTASDDVWDTYIREYPDARSYRTKTKPNYNDLCVIYGSSTADGRHNFSGQEIDIDEDFLGVKIGEAKDSQATTSSDRSRTDWTPPMDRYFIDLMLEQVHRGCMNDHKFNKQAWNDMVAMFNAKFGSQHDKDVLRSRYKNLRKRYNDMKNLLDQSGFTWDETRQMVTANDDVWDAYIKEHPDARLYRTKTVPNYNDLCLIYVNTTTNGRYNHSGRGIDADNDILGAKIGERKDDQEPASGDCLSTEWTPSMDRYFIDLMLEQVHEGNKNDYTFKEQAWTHMVSLFNEEFQLHYDKYVLESRYISLMKQCNDIKNLLNQSEFAWDEIRQIVTANDDVWDAYVKEHPDALLYRTKILDGYNDLCMIFGNGTSDGRYTCSGQDMDLDHDVALVMYVSPRDPLDDAEESSSHSGRDMDISDQRNKRRSVTPQHSRKLQRTDEFMLDALSEMKGAVTSLTNKKEHKNSISIESVIDALQAIPDIDDDLLLDACDLLEDEKKAKTFLVLDVALRKKWLLRKLRP
ncbi:hypothetical protein HHK36_013779 [Tetracentron sinense]|uniref:L10-interacting MYB domain-containing protein n=1 Tax=Tetracentron sinense TaxID=13715 RepID=A0A834Z7P6_TETSI|nr:hypothetical protein HHK36_013779 [Tetracentron sinense]